MKTLKTLATCAMLAVLVGPDALAHHGLTAFDRTTRVTLKGTVIAFHYVNPHCVVEFEVTDDKGQVQKWQAELTNPRNLKGWTATSLEPGVIVTVTGYRAKSGALFLWVTDLTASNGTKLKGGGG